jgi:hypothetical protein
VAGLAVQGEVGGDLAEDAAELEPVPGAASDAHAAGRIGVEIDDEVPVRCVLEQARLERRHGAGSVGEVALGERLQQGLVAGARRTVERVRVDGLAEMVGQRQLEAGAVHGEPGEVSLGHLEVEDRKPLGREQLRPERLEPADHLALRGHQVTREPHQPAHPRPARQDEPLGRILAALRPHAHAVACELPAEHALAFPHLRPRRARQLDVRDDAALRQQEAAVGRECSQ